jgi:hypothetical protein
MALLISARMPAPKNCKILKYLYAMSWLKLTFLGEETETKMISMFYVQAKVQDYKYQEYCISSDSIIKYAFFCHNLSGYYTHIYVLCYKNTAF